MMTVSEAIKQLTEMEKRHGGKVLVYFDCPSCQQAFTPSFIAKVAVVITGEEKK
jgi:hypothetical protein